MINPTFNHSAKTTYSLYNGQVQMTFNTNGHRYQIGDTECVGVTTILSTLAKPALIPWAVKMTTDYIATQLKAGKAYDELQIQSILKEAKLAHRKKKEDAGDLGSLIHNWIERYIKGEKPEMPTNEKMQKAILSFLKWTKDEKVKFLKSEQPVYSRKYNFAGTCDFTCEIDGKKYVGDVKTSNAIYNEYMLQVAAYRYCLQEEFEGQDYDGMIIVRVPKDDSDIEIVRFNNYKELATTFIHLLFVYRQLQLMTNTKEVKNKNGYRQ